MKPVVLTCGRYGGGGGGGGGGGVCVVVRGYCSPRLVFCCISFLFAVALCVDGVSRSALEEIL
jgi:hypothetical protein